MKRKTKTAIQSALLRAARTALQSFLAVVLAAGTDYVHVSTLKAAAIAGGAAVLAALQRALDEAGVSPVPPG